MKFTDLLVNRHRAGGWEFGARRTTGQVRRRSRQDHDFLVRQLPSERALVDVRVSGDRAVESRQVQISRSQRNGLLPVHFDVGGRGLAIESVVALVRASRHRGHAESER